MRTCVLSTATCLCLPCGPATPSSRARSSATSAPQAWRRVPPSTCRSTSTMCRCTRRCFSRLNPKIAGSGEDLLERDLVAQGLEAADGTVRDSSTVEFVEMVGTEVLVNGAVLDQVVNGDEHAMGDSDRGPTLTTPRR